MHRPRLNEQEIKFILTLLQNGKGEIQQKLESVKDLKTEVSKIIQSNVQQLAEPESQVLKLFAEKYVYEGLIVKFDDLASGRKNRSGRPKAITSYAKTFLKELEP